MSAQKIKCNENFPVIFTHDAEISICQYEEGLSICGSATILDPSKDLGLAKLRTISAKESSLGRGFRFDADIRRLVASTMAQINAVSAAMGVLFSNADECNDAIFCPNAKHLPEVIRTEFGRTMQSYLAFLLNFTHLGIAIQYVTFSWAAVCISGGIVEFFRRFKNHLSRVLERGNVNCCSFIILILAQLIISLNPFSKRDSHLEGKLRQLEAIIESVEAVRKEESKARRKNLMKIDLLETRLDRMLQLERMKQSGKIKERGKYETRSARDLSSFQEHYAVPRIRFDMGNQQSLEEEEPDCNDPLVENVYESMASCQSLDTILSS